MPSLQPRKTVGSFFVNYWMSLQEQASPSLSPLPASNLVDCDSARCLHVSSR